MTIFKRLAATFIISFMLTAPLLAFVLDGFSLAFSFSRALWSCVFFTSVHALWLLSKPYLKHWLFADTSPVIKSAPGHIERLGYCIIFILALAVPFLIGKYWLSVAILALIYILLGLGLNIVVGMAGLLDLGFVAFYAVGAYGYALLSQYFGFSFWMALPACALMAAFFGAIIGFPVLRMHGDYLAIVTLGFGEIIRLVLNNWQSLTGGPNGIFAPTPTLWGIEFTRRAKQGGIPFHEWMGVSYDAFWRYCFLYFVLLLVVCLVIMAASRLRHLPLGRAWEALREDEIATRSLGIYHVTTKLSAFSLGAFIGGIGGAFFAAHQGFINPSSFTFLESALILSIVVLGGMGSIPGVILAALFITLLPEALRDFSQVRMLIFGALMVLMMIWRPRGLLRIARRIYLPPGEKV